MKLTRVPKRRPLGESRRLRREIVRRMRSKPKPARRLGHREDAL